MEFKLLLAGILLYVIAHVLRHIKNVNKVLACNKFFIWAHEWIETGWSAVIIAAIIMYFLLQAFKIPSGSMRMTLLEGDHLFVNKFIYGFHIPLTDGKKIFPINKVQRGDIIVFRAPIKALVGEERVKKIEKDFIKRCVAIGGDKVEVVNKKLFINDKPVEESYLNFEDMNFYQSPKVFKTQKDYQAAWENGDFADMALDVVRDNFGPVIVPAGCYFAMGDNRDRSFDSRFWGPLPENRIKGKPLFLYWPANRWRLIK